MFFLSDTKSHKGTGCDINIGGAVRDRGTEVRPVGHSQQPA